MGLMGLQPGWHWWPWGWQWALSALASASFKLLPCSCPSRSWHVHGCNESLAWLRIY